MKDQGLFTPGAHERLQRQQGVLPYSGHWNASEWRRGVGMLRLCSEWRKRGLAAGWEASRWKGW